MHRSISNRSSSLHYIICLTIAGSDSGGGAGIQADIKTMSALGCFATSAITSVTVQNTLGVSAIQKIQPEIVAGQIRAVMDDLHPLAIKIGMVNDAETISAIASTLKSYNSLPPLIIDPVMVSTSGSRLMQSDALDVFKTELMPMATLLTPNIPEAEVLSGVKIENADSIDIAAQRILSQQCKAVLVKGGHMEGEKVDRLYCCNLRSSDDSIKECWSAGGRSADDTEINSCNLRNSWFENNYSSKVLINSSCNLLSKKNILSNSSTDTNNTHGTGCTLSSAIAAYMARGEKMEDAVRMAKDYIAMAIAEGADVETGGGHGPVNHFFNPQKLIKR